MTYSFATASTELEQRMTLAEIRELRDKLEPLSFGIGGIKIKFPFKTEEIWLQAFPNTQEHLEEMQRILEPYRRRFLRIDLELDPDPILCWTFLQKIDFFGFKAVLVPALQAEIAALSNRAEPDPLYAFVLGISPEHSSLVVSWNTPANWAICEAEYAARGHPGGGIGTKYNGPDFRCLPLTEHQAVWQPVWDVLENHRQVRDKFYDLTGGGGAFLDDYKNRFRSTAVFALKEVVADLQNLPRTDDFVCYVQDYVGGSDDLFLALETIKVDQLRELMPWLFQTALMAEA